MPIYINPKDPLTINEVKAMSEDELLYLFTPCYKEGYLEVKVINIIRTDLSNQVVFSLSKDTPYLELPLVIDEDSTVNDSLILHMGDAVLKTTQLLDHPEKIMQTALFSYIDSVIEGEFFYILNLLVVSKDILDDSYLKQGYCLKNTTEVIPELKSKGTNLSQLVIRALFPVKETD